jgi:hypothetical protein
MPDHSALQALLQDRKTSTKGRASRWMDVCLVANLAKTLALAEEDLAAAHAVADNAAENADKRAGGKVAIDPELTKQVKAAEKAVAEAQVAVDAASVTVTFTALKANDYDELLKQHPPREGNQMDAMGDRNQATFPDALMLASATKVEDAEGNLVDMDATELLETLSDGERIVACRVANEVNGKSLSVPSSDANSRNRPRSGSSSSRR